MRALPIVERELRVASRHRGMYISRSIAAIGALGLLGFVVISGQIFQTPLDSQGKQLFGILSGFAFLFCLAAGMRSTADCVSEEKREGTLGLIFLTDLRGHDVVLGKFAAGSIDSFLALAGMVPVLAVVWLLGGVEAMEFVRMALLLMNTMFWSLAAGLMVSAFSQQERKALAGTFLILLLQTLGPFAIGFYYLELSGAGFGRAIDWMFLTPSPMQGFRLVSSSSPGWTQEMYWSTMAFIHASGWGFLFLAIIVLPMAGRLRPKSGPVLRWMEKWRTWTQGRADVRRQYRRHLLNQNPYAWLACRDRFKVSLVWVMLIGLAAIWTWAYTRYPATLLDRESLFVVMGLTHGLIKWWVISEVCTRAVEDNRSGAFELLLCTPMSSREMIRGQGVAVRKQFGKPMIVVVLADLLFLYLGTYQGYGLSVSPGEWIWVWTGCFLMLPADVWAITWFAMQSGLKSRSANRAIFVVLWRILVLPLLAAAGSFVLFSGVFTGRPMFVYWSAAHTILCWQAAGLAISLASGVAAKRRLAGLINDAAVSRFDRGKAE